MPPFYSYANFVRNYLNKTGTRFLRAIHCVRQTTKKTIMAEEKLACYKPFPCPKVLAVVAFVRDFGPL